MSDPQEILEELQDVQAEQQAMKAKKGFVILHNDFFREIKTGDDLSDLPEKFIQNMKTEGVL